MPTAPPPTLHHRIDGLFRRISVRLFLSICILLSLIPHTQQAQADRVFLLIFGAEFILRVVGFVSSLRAAHPGSGRPSSQPVSVRSTRRRLSQLAFLVVDLFALISFIPWQITSANEARFLRLFRLSRMVLLIGYWSPLVRDFWLVLSRRERLRQVILLGVIVLFMAFSGAAILEQLAAQGVDFDADGLSGPNDDGFITHFWWSFRQIQDAGNLVPSTVEPVSLTISLILTLAGLVLVSFLIGLGSDVMRELMTLSRNRPVGMRGHTVVVHLTPGLGRLLTELSAYYEKLFSQARITVVGDDEERPAVLRAAELSRIPYRHVRSGGDDRGQTLTERADIGEARRVVILSLADSAHPDALSASTVLSVREANATAWIICEVLEQSNASAIRVAGGQQTIVVPTEKFLALFASVAVRSTEHLSLLTELLTTRQGHEIYTYFYNEPGLTPKVQQPGLECTPGALPFDWLYEAGITAPPNARCVPLGVLVRQRPPRAEEAAEETGGPDAAVAQLAKKPTLSGGSRGSRTLPLPPESRAPSGAPSASGSGTRSHGAAVQEIAAIIAVGPTFNEVKAFAQIAASEFREDLPTRMPPKRALPKLTAAPERRIERVLILGYRPASVDLCATLMAAAGADAEVLMLLSDAATLDAATKAIREHSMHIHAGLWQEHGPWGTFVPREGEPDALCYRPEGRLRPAGRLRLRVADWTSERTLLSLPCDEGALPTTIGDWDVVVALGGSSADADWRTSMTALKIADIIRAHPSRFPRGFHLLAGVADGEHGRRLGQSFERTVQRGRDFKITVIPVEEMRASFTFQAVVVPGFDAVFSELLSPWGQTVEQLFPGASEPIEDDAPWTFVSLARCLRVQQMTLIAIDLHAGAGQTRRIIGAPIGPADASFCASHIASAWVLRDRGRAPSTFP